MEGAGKEAGGGEEEAADRGGIEDGTEVEVGAVFDAVASNTSTVEAVSVGCETSPTEDAFEMLVEVFKSFSPLRYSGGRFPKAAAVPVDVPGPLDATEGAVRVTGAGTMAAATDIGATGSDGFSIMAVGVICSFGPSASKSVDLLVPALGVASPAVQPSSWRSLQDPPRGPSGSLLSAELEVTSTGLGWFIKEWLNKLSLPFMDISYNLFGCLLQSANFRVSYHDGF